MGLTRRVFVVWDRKKEQRREDGKTNEAKVDEDQSKKKR